MAKFAAGGKPGCKKDLGMIAMSYGNVFVGSISMGANPMHAIRTIRAAESYRGTSLLIAFSHCIGWGIDMQQGMNIQKDAVACGYWPLYSFDPRDEAHPFQLASKKPVGAFKDFAMKEARFAMLARSKPDDSARLLELGQQDIDKRYHFYEQLAGVDRASGRRGSGGSRRQRRKQSEGLEGGGSMSVDLSTTYLGLKLKNPLVISACPLTRRDRPAAAAGAGRRGGGRLALAVRGADRARRGGNDQGPRVRHRELRRSADLLPRAGRLSHRPGGISRNHRRGEEGGDDSDHRQPQRHEQGRLGPLCEDDARRRGRRPGVEHLLRGRRPRHDRPGRGIPLPRPRGRREAVDLDSAGGQDRAVLQRDGQHGRAAGRGRRRRPGAVQPLLPARHRPGDAWRPSRKLHLSTPYELLVPLRWIAILHGRVKASLAATGGIHDAAGLLKALLAGADVGMIASVLYQKGVEQVGNILAGMQQWMEENEYDSVEQLKGSMSRENCPDPAAFQRGNYMKTLTSFVGKAI